MITHESYIELKRLVDEYENSQQQSVNEFDRPPILVGHLNKVFGYNGYEKIEIGSEVYLHQDRYFFVMFPTNGGKPVPCRFYKETLSPCINFLEQ